MFVHKHLSDAILANHRRVYVVRCIGFSEMRVQRYDNFCIPPNISGTNYSNYAKK